jgi:benzoate-CoA ligase family protein
MVALRSPTLTVNPATSPATIRFGAGFNVAVPFIDRHLEEGRGDRIAYVTTSGRTVTYADLAAGVNRCGNALRGLDPGARVILVVKDCPEFLFLFWGSIKAGLVPVPLNTLLRTEDYRWIIEDSGCAAVVWSPEFAGEVGPAVRAADPGPAVALPVEGEGEGRTLLSLMDGAADTLAAEPADALDPCFWLYSSGSTGRPKGAVHRHRDMVVTSQWFGREVLGVGPDDLTFSASKLFFAYGLGNAATVPLWTGSPAVLLDEKPTPANTLAVIERFRPTVYYGVPTLYAAQLQALEATDADLSSLRLCFSAGEPLPAEIFRRWKQRTGKTILDGIGSTEALHIFLCNRPDDARPGSSGRPVPGYTVRIVDDTDAEVPPGEVGRLQVKGWSTAAFYWNNPEQTVTTMRGEWLDTGDTFRCDEDGRFQYCGRSNDMLKVGGIWCSPIEIENRMIAHPDVLEAAVVGLEDSDGLVKPEAWVVLREGVRDSDPLREALVRHCKEGLAPYKFPRRIHFLDDLPKTATGKIQRFRLRQMAAAKTPDPKRQDSS